MGSFQHDGLWWDPRDPSKRLVGTLRFDERDGTLLTLTVPTEKPEFFPALQAYDVILGVTTNGNAITLIGCFDRFTRGTLPGVPRTIEVFANSLIVGFHCENPDPLLATATASFSHLNDWWGRSGIESDQTVKLPDFGARYRSTAPLVVHDDGRFRVSIRSAFSGSVGSHQSSLREDIQIEVQASTPMRLSEFQPVIQACGDLLSIACLTFCGTEEITLTQPSSAGAMTGGGTYHSVPLYKPKTRSSQLGHMLIQFSEIEGRAPAVFDAWLSQSEKLHSARVLYLSGVYGPGFVESKLLALTQAAEAFHRRFCPGLYMDVADFERQVFEPLKAAVPRTIDKSLRTAIIARLTFANEHSLRRRMQTLFAEHDQALSVLVEKPTKFVSPIVDHRNDFTHFPTAPASAPPDQENSNDPERVLRYNWILRVLLEACFLKAMGFSTEEITSLARRCETYRQVSARFFRAKPPTDEGAPPQPG